MHANNSGNQDGWGVLDPDGRIDPHAPALIALGRSAEALRGLHARLLSADLTLLGGRTVATMSAHVAVFTVAERICGSLRFSAGAAMEPNGAVALVAASYDALLARWDGSVLSGGATRLVVDGTCRGALVVSGDGTHSVGDVDGISPLVQFRGPTDPGDRLAVGTSVGNFRAFSTGTASVVLALGRGRSRVRRVERWFDDLGTALG